MAFLAIIGYGLLGAYELIPLYKQKHWRELWVNSFLTVCSFSILLLMVFDIQIPSPSEPIKQLILLFQGK